MIPLGASVLLITFKPVASVSEMGGGGNGIVFCFFPGETHV